MALTEHEEQILNVLISLDETKPCKPGAPANKLVEEQLETGETLFTMASRRGRRDYNDNVILSLDQMLDYLRDSGDYDSVRISDVSSSNNIAIIVKPK